jgi:hypothetical protein
MIMDKFFEKASMEIALKLFGPDSRLKAAYHHAAPIGRVVDLLAAV